MKVFSLVHSLRKTFQPSGQWQTCAEWKGCTNLPTNSTKSIIPFSSVGWSEDSGCRFSRQTSCHSLLTDWQCHIYSMKYQRTAFLSCLKGSLTLCIGIYFGFLKVPNLIHTSLSVWIHNARTSVSLLMTTTQWYSLSRTSVIMNNHAGICFFRATIKVAHSFTTPCLDFFWILKFFCNHYFTGFR